MIAFIGVTTLIRKRKLVTKSRKILQAGKGRFRSWILPEETRNCPSKAATNRRRAVSVTHPGGGGLSKNAVARTTVGVA